MSKPKRILVVDDEELNRSLLKGLLASLGYTPESASDGFQALEKLNAGFDLVLMDVMMPGMDGIEVVRRIRENRELYDIPIIMVTVLYDRDTRLRAVQAGANDFIAKPIDILEVSVRIQSLLKMKEAQDEIKRHRAEREETVEKRTALPFWRVKSASERSLRPRVTASSSRTTS
jgi:putative two-component system response regulator